jgi:peptidoglycan/xylan/chitin deacetylase (PgdA/CDA1 family)
MKRTTVRGVFFSPACVGVMAVWLVGAVRAVAPAGQPSAKWPGRMGIVVFQFDDGSVGHYTHAFRILQKYSLKGSFGVVTGILDGSRGRRWSRCIEPVTRSTTIR